MKRKAYYKYLAALLLFGSNGVVASHISLNSYEIVLFRALLGSLLLIAVFLVSKRELSFFRHKRDALLIIASGVAMAADWLFLFEAYTQIGVSMSLLINYCGPAIVMALSPVLFKERVTWPKITALVFALAGVFLIGGKAAIDKANAWGLLCAVLSAVSYAAMVICNKLSKEVTGFENATLQLVFGFVTIAVFTGFSHGFAIDLKAGDWLPVLWLGLLNTGVGCWLYFSSIGELPVQTVAICGYLEPLSAVLFSVLFLHEILSPLQILGAVLILGGALLGECFNKKAIYFRKKYKFLKSGKKFWLDVSFL